MSLSERLFVARAVRAAQRAARARERTLEHDLGGFTTTAEIRDLRATLDRYPDSAAGELRDILSRRAQRSPRSWPAMRGL